MGCWASYGGRSRGMCEGSFVGLLHHPERPDLGVSRRVRRVLDASPTGVNGLHTCLHYLHSYVATIVAWRFVA